MTQTNGVGVTERSEDWTIRSIFEDWIAESIVDQLEEDEELISVTVAPKVSQ